MERVTNAGGTLVSGKYWYDKSKKKVEVRCGFNHLFYPYIWTLIRSNQPTWCAHPDCVSRRISFVKTGVKQDSVSAELTSRVQELGGSVLSGNVGLLTGHLQLRCKRGHKVFRLQTKEVIGGKWCVRCKAHEELETLAHDRGGALLGVYQSAKSKVLWRCDVCNDDWLATPDSIRSGSWCPSCGGSKPLTIEDIRLSLADETAKRGIDTFDICRDDLYSRADWFIRYRCEIGHEVCLTVHHFKKGVGCGQCKTGSIGEALSREVLEHLLSTEFDKVRPTWLTDNEGTRLELDGYSQELQLAFEYQGQQHYEFVPLFHKDEEEFRTQSLRDKVKREVCQSKQIKLIEIPYTIETHNLEAYLRQRLSDLNFVELNPVTYDLDSFKSVRNSELSSLQQLAKKNGGQLLSTTYFNSQTPLQWQCGLQHDPWYAIASSVRMGTWCPTCGDKQTGDKNATPIERIAAIAEQWGGYLVGPAEDVNKKREYIFACVNKHQFRKTSTLLAKGSWCMKCEKLIASVLYRLDLNSFKEAASRHDGFFLSKHVLNVQQKVLWKCSSGHIWLATGNSVIHKGSWCPSCAGRKNVKPVDLKQQLEDEERVFKAAMEPATRALKAREMFRQANGAAPV